MCPFVCSSEIDDLQQTQIVLRLQSAGYAKLSSEIGEAGRTRKKRSATTNDTTECQEESPIEKWKPESTHREKRQTGNTIITVSDYCGSNESETKAEMFSGLNCTL